LWIAHAWLCGAAIVDGRWPEALAWAEKAHSVVPQSPAVTGLLAGVLARTGESERSMELRTKLGSGDAYGAPAGLFYFHAAAFAVGAGSLVVRESRRAA